MHRSSAMLVLALVSPFLGLAFLFLMHSFEQWLLGAPSDVPLPVGLDAAGATSTSQG